MGPTQRILLAIVALTFVGACSYAPRMDADAELTGVRAQYLRDNPAGAFNDHINKGEIVKGMNLDEVLASWGVPARREKNEELATESWTYLIKDPYSSDYVLYDVAFENRVVARWVLDRHLSGSGGVTQSTASRSTSTLPENTSSRSSGVAKRN